MSEKFPVSGAPIPEIDLRKISIKEWRLLFDPAAPSDQGDAVLAKAAGMSVKEIGELAMPDYRALVKAVLDKAAKPIDEIDPKN